MGFGDRRGSANWGAGARLDGLYHLPGRWTVSLKPERSQTLHFQLLDGDGLTNKRPVRFAVRMLKDKPPRVGMKVPGAGDMVTTEAVLPIELDMADDYGLAQAELVYQIKREGELEHVLELKNFSPGASQFQDRSRASSARVSSLSLSAEAALATSSSGSAQRFSSRSLGPMA